MREPVTEKIDGTEYEISPFGAVEGLKLAGRLGKVAGPVLAPLLAAGQSGAMTDTAAKAIAQALADDFDVDATVTLIQSLTSQTSAKGVGVLSGKAFDQHFAANYGALVELLAAIVRVNFSGFFSGLGGAMKAVTGQPAA